MLFLQNGQSIFKNVWSYYYMICRACYNSKLGFLYIRKELEAGMAKSGQFNAKEAGVVFEHADIDGDGKDRNIQESTR